MFKAPHVVLKLHIFSTQDGMHLKYKHDGSEGPEDHFTLLISDGVNYNEKVVNVKVMPLKDEQPQVTKNAGLKVQIFSLLLLTTKETKTNFSLTAKKNVYIKHMQKLRGSVFPLKHQFVFKKASSFFKNTSSFVLQKHRGVHFRKRQFILKNELALLKNWYF